MVGGDTNHGGLPKLSLSGAEPQNSQSQNDRWLSGAEAPGVKPIDITSKKNPSGLNAGGMKYLLNAIGM